MFLEDILRSTGYINKVMLKYQEEKQQEEKERDALSGWCSAQENKSELGSRRQRSVPRAEGKGNLLDDGGDTVYNQLTEKDASTLEPRLIKEMDSCLSDIWLYKDVDAFAQVFHLILTKNVSRDVFWNDSSDSESEDKTTARLAVLELDEWLHLKLDPEEPCGWCLLQAT
ncbi:3'-5' RNA helicase YTHDC2-like isoform X2 [Cuculus canorus]|uniref:3'-5' RNA helicase YTHDC2-like isoform X2 n=1 Tax=Cuculus canorus TaxID=55661 RepID=UPI0023AB551D|nr:3'-5' RNA helicase YTHDC2-like isoform X2 [Cuculus canorus]